MDDFEREGIESLVQNHPYYQTMSYIYLDGILTLENFYAGSASTSENLG
jgi:hypothetical protein